MWRCSQIFVLLFFFVFVSCQNQSSITSNIAISNIQKNTPIPSPTLTPSPTPIPKQPTLKITLDGEVVSPQNSNSPIRKIDFENFTYPEPADWDKPLNRDKSFRLKNGEFVKRPYNEGWHFIVRGAQRAFADLTGDGEEEAILILFPDHQGTAIYYYIYFYTLVKGKPKPIWAFETGDRADGGFREIRVEDNEIVIELNGKNKYIGGDLYSEDETSKGACCPTMYTRARYKWNGRRFVLQEKPESFPLN